MLPSKPGQKCKHNYLWCSIRNKHLHSLRDAYCEQAVLGGGTKRWNWNLPNGIWTSKQEHRDVSGAVWGGEEALSPLPSFPFFPCLSRTLRFTSTSSTIPLSIFTPRSSSSISQSRARIPQDHDKSLHNFPWPLLSSIPVYLQDATRINS